MSDDYKHNHYVPIWYQKRFLLPGQDGRELFYLDREPPLLYRDSTGRTVYRKEVYRQGLRKCFAQDDLYTLRLGIEDSREIERRFFGPIDWHGRRAVEFLESLDKPTGGRREFTDLMRYMSVQKLRTPKGLGWLSEFFKTTDRDVILRRMVELHQLHAAIWTESVWHIADASESTTKFIVSDHPVTVYNRRCGPRSDFCRGFNDPAIWLNGTHTLFPLSLEKVLILTNLSWARNPYQSETSKRPHPNPLRGALLHTNDIQILRRLNETEVRQINFIIKQRALRHIGAAQEEWLYPEQFVEKSDWARFGDGYLLMPDPRSLHLGGEVMIGLKDGSVTGFDEYGRRPGDPDYGREGRSLEEAGPLDRFKAEFARMFGNRRRSRSLEFGRLENEYDSDELHQSHLERGSRRGRSRRR